MNLAIEEVLKATSSKGKFDGTQELAYQVGVLAAWVARLAKNDSQLMREIDSRNTKKKIDI